MMADTIAKELAPAAEPFVSNTRLSSLFSWWATDDALLVIAGAATTSVQADIGLAHGLRHVGNRDLWLVLPERSETPTLRRAAWLRPKVRVWTGSNDGRLIERIIPARPEELSRFREPVRVAVADLGSRAGWIAPLLEWAKAMPLVVNASRGGYVDYQCDGRSVLHITPTTAGYEVRAGTDWSRPVAPHEKAVRRQVTGMMTAAQAHELVAAASRSCHLRLAGLDKDNAEHRLQARLEARHIGLTSWLRELPAVRPTGAGAPASLGGKRGFIDFLGFKDKTLHVVETKIGPDDFLILQGLDYWTWAMGQRDRLAVLFALPTTAPKVVIDFVVAEDVKHQLLGAYTPPQALALAGDVDWQFHIVEQWGDGADPVVRRLPPRTLP